MPRFRRSGSFSGRARAPRRQILNVAATAEVDGLVTVVGVAKALFSMGIVVGSIPVTLVRTRGRIMTSLQAVASAGIDRFAVGMIVVSSDAFAAGVGSLPGPLSDGTNDWVVWSPLTNIHLGNIVGENAVDRVDVDSRGMRKLKEGDVLAIMVEVESDVAGATYDLTFSFRQQFKV